MLLIINCIAEAWPGGLNRGAKGQHLCTLGGNKFAKLMRKPIKRHRYAARTKTARESSGEKDEGARGGDIA